MNFSNKNIFFNIEGDTKENILLFISIQAKELGICDDQEGLLKDLNIRESEISTGLQDGFAIPHARSAYVKEPAIMFLKTKQELPWETFDKSNVRYIFSLLVPIENENNTHLQMLSTLATCLMEDSFRDKVKECEDKDALTDYIFENMKEGIQ